MFNAQRLGWAYPLPILQSMLIGALIWGQWDSFGLHFERPQALWTMLLIPGLTVVMIGYWSWRARMMRKHGDLALMQAMSATQSWPKHVIKTLCFLLGLWFVILAWARPQWGQADTMLKRTGVDVVFALDLSKSMMAQDIVPSRLQAAKDEISTTLSMLGGDRAGLVIFTSVSFAQSPLTTDYGALRFYLKKLKPDQMPFGGTNIGRALNDGVDLLTGLRQHDPAELTLNGGSGQESQDSPKLKRAKTQLVVLITDGEDHESNPLEAARAASQHNIHVVTVGMGSAHGERVPVYREDGSLSGYKKNTQGEFVYSRLDEDTLKKLSTATGGVYIRYQGENSVANALASYIDQLEKSELETLLRKRYKDRFMWFLWPGMLLILLSLLISERAPQPERRFALMALVMALMLGGATGCEDAFVRPLSEVERGNTALAAKDYAKALSHYREAERKIPATPKLHYDLGRAHLGLGQAEQAQDYFTRALETDDHTLRFKALYNLALALEAQDKLKEASQTLREAITAYAHDLEQTKTQAYQDAIHNLELLTQRLYPPCAKLEDDREENDTPQQASRIEEPELKDRTLCGLDDDWYAIPVLVGTQIEVTAQLKDLRAEPDPERAFLPQPSDLELGLYDATGQQLLSVDRGQAEATQGQDAPAAYGPIGQRKLERRLMRFTVTEEMLGAQGSALLLKVSAADELEFKYDLKIDAIPPCSAIDDKLEPNATADQAKPLKPGSEQLHLCAKDEDWYAMELELGDTLFVDLQPSEDIEFKRPPQLELEIRRQGSDKILASGKPESGLIVGALWEVDKPGTYLVRVRGVDGEQQGPYAMQSYVYAPCPLGDDRFEDNDDSSTAALLDPKAPMHRYLRLCPGESDYFKLPLGEPAGAKDGKSDDKAKAKPTSHKLALGLSLLSPPKATDKKAAKKGSAVEAAPGDGEEEEALSFALLSPTGDQIIAESVELSSEEISPKPTKGKGGEEQAPTVPIHRILQQDKLEDAQALIRVKGPATFYHIIQLNPQSGQQDDQSQQKDQPKDQEDKQDKQKPQDQQDGEQPQQEQDQQKQDQADPQGQDEPKDGEQPKEGDEDPQEQREDNSDPNNPKDGEQDPKDEEQQEGASPEGEEQDEPEGDKKDGKKGKPTEKKSEDPELRRIEDILRALEQTDDNFQMRKALQREPGRYIEKDW